MCVFIYGSAVYKSFNIRCSFARAAHIGKAVRMCRIENDEQDIMVMFRFVVKASDEGIYGQREYNGLHSPQNLPVSSFAGFFHNISLSCSPRH
jgi:hypothetical protein